MLRPPISLHRSADSYPACPLRRAFRRKCFADALGVWCRPVVLVLATILWFGRPAAVCGAEAAGSEGNRDLTEAQRVLEQAKELHQLHPTEAGNRDLLEAQRVLDQARELQEKYRLRVAVPNAVRDDVEVEGPAAAVSNTTVAAPHSSNNAVWFGILLTAAALLALRRFVPGTFDSLLSYLKPRECLVVDGASNDASEDRAFADFIVSFKAGPPGKTPQPAAATSVPVADAAREAAPPVESITPDPLREFFLQAPDRLAEARKRLQAAVSAAEPAVCQEVLTALGHEIREIKGMAGIPELLPSWQLASVLESLVKQLLSKPDKVTPSTLSSIAAGLDVLSELCRPGVDSNFFSNPPPRFLAVDDDSISRHAVSLALKKAFNQPDVAPNGPAALELVAQHKYDAIFLDIMMPAMDGFELCSKIHQSQTNQKTPVVFVSCRKDFDARAQSRLCGGTDLLEKPFLTFEVALKALTLTMRTRLQASAGEDDEVGGKPAAAIVPAAPAMVAAEAKALA